MKMIKQLVSTALVAASFSPLAITPAYATIVPSSTTAATMQSTCAADLAPYASVLLHDGTESFSTVVVETGQVDGAPTEVSGSRVINEASRFGTGTVTYSGLSIAGNPYRTGGSVNMFGDQVATNKNWSNSEYDFTANFDTVTTISYTCEVTQQTETHVAAVHIPGRKVQGYYTNPGHSTGVVADCNGFDETKDFWGEDKGACIFTQTGPAVDPVDIEESWTLDVPIDRTDLNTFHTVNETNTASGTGHEVNGGPFTQIGTWLAQKVVICISPSKTVKGGTPGAWANHNCYLGSKCTTAWFNVAPWSGGSQTSNGTYISVPAI